MILPRIIKDADCYPGMPVIFGNKETSIYGKHETDYEKSIFLPELLPLEDYDLIIILFSGGKDSTAAYYKLRELGVPKSKIELWHHDSTTRSLLKRLGTKQ